MIPTRLVTGASGAAREAAIAARLQPGESCAVILEGLPDGEPRLIRSDHLRLERIVPGCMCCTGNLVLRVTLNRILRQRPSRLYLGVANAGHLDQLRSWLLSAPYDQLLELGPDLGA